MVLFAYKSMTQLTEKLRKDEKRKKILDHSLSHLSIIRLAGQNITVTKMNTSSIACLRSFTLIFILFSPSPIPAFQTQTLQRHLPRSANACRGLSTSILLNLTNKNKIGNTESVGQDELDELSPPSISLTKNSILFDPDAPTQKNNIPLEIWCVAKSIFPSFVTGAWEEGKGDRTPVEHLYNMIFVRLPVVGMGMVYIWNLLRGHGLYMNFGDGTIFEVPSLIVLGAIYVILR